MVSTHYITWPFSFWIWRRRCLKFAWFWPFGALPLGPHGGHTYYLNNFESPTPKNDFCQVWLKSNHAFSRRRWKCKKFTDDGRRTKTKTTAIAHLSLRLRWAKNRVGRLVIFYIFFTQHYAHLYTHTLCIKTEKIQAEMLETLKLDHIFFSLNYIMKISYDFLWQLHNFLQKLCNNKKIKKNSRVGGIFRVGRVTPIQHFFFCLS